MAHSNVLSLPDRRGSRLRIQAQTCMVTSILVARLAEIEPQHRAACSRRLIQLIDLYTPDLLPIEGVTDHLNALAELPHAARLDRIADHLIQQYDAAQATPLPEVPTFAGDPQPVRTFTAFAEVLLNYTLFLQMICVMHRRLAS